MNDSKKTSDTRERHKHSKKHKHHRSRSRERHRKYDSKSDSYSQSQASSVPSTSRSLNQERLPELHRSLDDERHEEYFDFTKHKYSLNKIFFRDQGLIKRLLALFQPVFDHLKSKPNAVVICHHAPHSPWAGRWIAVQICVIFTFALFPQCRGVPGHFGP